MMMDKTEETKDTAYRLEEQGEDVIITLPSLTGPESSPGGPRCQKLIRDAIKSFSLTTNMRRLLGPPRKGEYIARQILGWGASNRGSGVKGLTSVTMGLCLVLCAQVV